MKGIILETAVPIRLEPSDRAEMVNQLLFGELYSVLEEEVKWLKIQSEHDAYSGWLDKKQHTEFPEKTHSFKTCFEESICRHSVNGSFKVTPGAYIPDEEILKNYNFESVVVQEESNRSIRNASFKFMNAPYLWGGRTPLGIDCSGFTQLVYRMQGLDLPRDASQQVNEGDVVTFLDEAKEGDLAFFDNAEGKITHVGIILEEPNTKKIIHASGRVRIDKIDHQGIYNDDLKVYTHQLRTIKTLI